LATSGWRFSANFAGWRGPSGPPAYHLSNGNWRTVIDAVNEATGRRITVRSPQRLRPLPAKECEFCRHAFNRGDGEFTCPYCGKRWRCA
jgi:hypothetical protein